MKKAILSFIGKYFGESLDLHVQSFNLLGFAGMAACAVVACISFAQNAIVNAAIRFFFFCAAFCLMRVAGKMISYHVCSWFVVAAVFMIGFPALFFSAGGYSASHEMKTPLTVTSVNVQTVIDILEDMGEYLIDPEPSMLLKNAQNEIMRLSRMVDGMLTLASMSESTDRQKLDFSSLMHSGIETLRLNLGKRCNTIEACIEPGLIVFGNADLLSQVLANIL